MRLFLFFFVPSTAYWTHPTTQSPEYTHECYVWLSHSTIPGAGLGLFAGRDFRKQETVTPGDITIPLIDMPWHSQQEEFDNTFLWDDYTWHYSSFEGMENEALEVYGASMGIGALPNCLFGQNNVDESSTRLDTAGLDRSEPATGSFTPYHGREGMASRKIEAGEELFVDYGSDYFTGSRGDIFAMIPFDENLEMADYYLSRFLRLVRQLERQQKVDVEGEILSDSWKRDLYDIISKDLAKIWLSRNLAALPQDWYDLTAEERQAIDEYGSQYQFAFRSVRELEDLYSNGSCLDHLYVKSAPGKGRGAFAKHSIPAGHVIAPLPLLHLSNRTILDMHRGTFVGDEYVPFVTDPATHAQLLLNYCFGHDESTLLLCPYGVTSSAINHDDAPNARLEWNEELSLQLDWRKKPLQDWGRSTRAGLVWNVVATRDIGKDEEVTIDYGPQWRKAWKRHVKRWQTPPQYTLASTLNEDYLDLVLTLPNETITEYDPATVELRCREEYRLMGGMPSFDGGKHYPCRVIGRRQDANGKRYYRAELYIAHHDKNSCQAYFDEILWDAPRDAFFFKDEVYGRDHAQWWSFRHHLQIPDHVLPKIWLNLR